jgi:hypothetical protein
VRRASDRKILEIERLGIDLLDGTAQNVAAKALRRLGQHDALARDGGGDDGAVRGALDSSGIDHGTDQLLCAMTGL